MLHHLKSLTDEALAGIGAADSLATLDACVAKYTGKRGSVNAVLRGIGKLDPAERGPVGRAANEARQAIDEAANARRRALTEAAEADLATSEWVDATLPPPAQAPWARTGGTIHPITQLIRRVEDICLGLGFDVLDGNWVEDDDHNFTKLNIPPDHPARDMQDTFLAAGRSSVAHAHQPGADPHHGNGQTAVSSRVDRACVSQRGTGRKPRVHVPPDRGLLR